MALEFATAPLDKDSRDVSSQNAVCAGEQHGAAQPLRLRGVFATAGSGLLARTFHLEALLRDRVLPAIGGGKRICRVDRSGDCIRTRCRLAELTVDVASALFDSAWDATIAPDA
jgi:hypothetical protein